MSATLTSVAGPQMRYVGDCTACGAPRYQAYSKGTNYCGYRGWCVRCYRRWRNHGKPASGPPPPRMGQGGGPAGCRLEDYEFLRSPEGGSLSQREAAMRLGVTLRTVQRYEARLRGQDVGVAA
jgi:hypothetical protein